MLLSYRVGRTLLRQTGNHRRLHTTIHTIRNPTASSISKHLESLNLSSSSVGLYLLHPELKDISSVLSTVQQGLGQCSSSIGSFAQSVTRAQPSGQDHAEAPFVTIATFTPEKPTEKLYPFRSTLVGRPPASVGRWHRPALSVPSSTADPTDHLSYPARGETRNEDRKGEEVGEIERALLGSLGYEKGESMGWEGLWRSERLEGRNEVDETGDMKGIEGLKGVTGVRNMLVLSDGLPSSTVFALERYFPYADKLGLLTEATPFLTGRPFTLFQDKDVFENGAVGIAFCETEDSRGLRVTMGVDYEGLQPLSEIETIENAQGNMLLTLRPSTSQNTKAQTNPTQLLIRVITAYQSQTNTARPSEAGSSDTGVILGKQMKEEEYYLAIWAPGARADEAPREVVRILSGDPSRGVLSLAMEEPLRSGQLVQYMHKPKQINWPALESRGGEISFVTLPSEESIASSSASTEETSSPGMLVGTEGGFWFSPAMSTNGRRTNGSVCKVFGARGWLKV